MRAACALAIAAALAGGVVGCGTDRPAAGPGALGGTPMFGFNDDALPGTYAAQASMGMPVRRFVVPWGSVEPSPGQFTWERFDTLYAQMTGAGLRPLLVAIGSPCWARPATPCAALQPAPEPAYDDAWADYVRELARRYPAAVGVEVWNEPNVKPLWPPHPDPERYTALLTAAYAAVKSVAPAMPVVSGGLFPANGESSFAIGDAEFLEGMYDAGARGHLDAIGAHPYPADVAAQRWDPGLMVAALDRLRAIRDGAGDEDTPLWATETGVSTHAAVGYPPPADEQEQADALLALVREVRAAPDVAVMLVHRLVDTAEPASAADGLAAVEAGFGVLRHDRTPKPSACALSELFGGALRC